MTYQPHFLLYLLKLESQEKNLNFLNYKSLILKLPINVNCTHIIIKTGCAIFAQPVKLYIY